MYAARDTRGPVDLAFTDRLGGVSGAPFDSLNLAWAGAWPGGDMDDDVAENHRRLLADFAPGDGLDSMAQLSQVHGSTVVEIGPDSPPHDARGRRHAVGDGLVTTMPGITLMVRVADCVPVLFSDVGGTVIGAAHCGRPGLVAGVVPATIAAMRELGARGITAWIGPYVCGACYEVPQQMQDDVASVEPATRSRTSWGSAAVDVGAGVRAQLERDSVAVVDLSRCTRESPDLFSYRREGERSGRQAGLIRVAP